MLLFDVLGGFTNLDKLFFLWLQKIANINNKLSVNVYKKEIFKYKNQFIKLLNEDIIDEDILNSINIDFSIINIFLDKNIKEEVQKIYNYIINNEYEIVTIEDEIYPRRLLELEEKIPFCYITNSKVNLNNKNIYMYFNNYYTKFARNLIEYFAKIINEEKANIITEYSLKSIENLEIISSDMFNNIKKNDKKNCIILPDTRYLEIFKINIIDILILIEARYESNIIKVVDMLLEKGKDIYVVPSNIFSKNNYFSNYLIKQGADIILNKWDLKFILKKIIC